MNLVEYHKGLMETKTFYNLHVSKVLGSSHPMHKKYTIHRCSGMSVSVNNYGMTPEKAKQILYENNDIGILWDDVIYWDKEENAQKGIENMIMYLFKRDYLK